MLHMLLEVQKVPSNDGGTSIATDFLYTTLEENSIHKETGYYLYGTARINRGISILKLKKRINYGVFCFKILHPAYATNHFSLVIFYFCRNFVHRIISQHQRNKLLSVEEIY